MALEINSEVFDKEVLESEIPVLVDFWAEWCAPCRAIAPILEELQEEFNGKCKICKINVDQNRDFSKAQGITSIPQLFLYKNGEKVDSLLGLKPKEELVEFIQKNL